jgi:bacillithiol biosynthesis cysteine-adding enzyme BshC
MQNQQKDLVEVLTTQKLTLSATRSFPKLFIDYISKNEKLADFYSYYPDIEGFKAVIEAKKFTTSQREILVKTLEKQYQNITSKPDFQLLLEANTFTVTTGHQLNIFTGPLYVIYKIITIINLAKALKEAYPAYHFVPIYWMASEDHDFEEIASFNLFGKNFRWETQQKGAVGRMNPKELQAVLEQLNEKIDLFENAYLHNDTLGDAVRQYMNELFGDKGLVCLDADEKALKNQLSEVIKDDLFRHSANRIVAETTSKIQSLGYDTQISPREINFFYLENGIRERIIKDNEGFRVLNTEWHFSEAEILELIENEPEKFSPNVVLRPLYQEKILPNLAYIGGPSEVPYWLQLKDMIQFYGEPFPMLMPRNFALVINQANQKRMDKLGIVVEDLFEDEVTLRKSFVEKNSENSLSLAFEIDEINDIFERILKKALVIDATLKGSVEAEKTKTTNALENLEKRIKKAEERNQETSVSQLLALKNKLFPDGGLQERKENFLNFYLNDKSFLDKLLENLDPLDYHFNIIEIG